ncbi:MAG TPA: hypothetical protein VM535_01935 [Candidatus Saccharimonadales bacterium]|nr:hypothetical protein [Candidatus Saccharimonadales bacterium]
MGRKNRKAITPQRCRLEAQREVRRTRNAAIPKAFGIRRPLERELSRTILSRMGELHAAGDLPESVELRRTMHATLFPHRAFGKQVLKGLAAGYHLGKLNSQLNSGDHGQGQTEAEMSGVNVYKGRVIYVKLDSPELEAERLHIAETMAAFGLRGLERAAQEATLHMTVGQSKKGMSVTEQRHVRQVIHQEIDQVHPQERPLTFESWEIYPSLDRWMQ